MSSAAATLPLPVVPPDVLAFAQEQGVVAYLSAVLAMIRRIFPTWSITAGRFLGDSGLGDSGPRTNGHKSSML
jgi:hypothetical protein